MRHAASALYVYKGTMRASAVAERLDALASRPTGAVLVSS